MKVHGGGDVQSQIFLTSALVGGVISFTPRPLYPRRKSLRYPLDMRLGGPQSRSGRRAEEKILDPTGTRTPTPRPSSPQPVAIPTELSQELVIIYLHAKRPCIMLIRNKIHTNKIKKAICIITATTTMMIISLTQIKIVIKK
jgi:hypothetical protein